MVGFEVEDGLVFWPERQIAALTPEFRGRWRGVFADGSVAHRQGPPPPGPWLPLADSLVLPELLLRLPEGGWSDPAGFRYPAQDLPALPPEPEAAPIEGLGCRPEQVIGLHSTPDDGCIWTTDLGEVPWKLSARRACRAHPQLFIANCSLLDSKYAFLLGLAFGEGCEVVGVACDGGMVWVRSETEPSS